MVIAVDTRMLADSNKDNYASFIYRSLLQLAEQNLQNRFIFFTDDVKKVPPQLPVNIVSIVITPKVNNRLRLRWWYDIKLPAALKKQNAEVLIGASFICSLRTTIPQILILNDYHSFLKKNNVDVWVSRKRLAASAKAASVFCTLTRSSKEMYCKLLQLNPEKVIVTNIATNEVHTPIHWKAREEVKEKYAAGCEYFICNCTEEDQLITLLKAFSIFKKWQKSNMKLLFTNIHVHDKAMEEKMSTYKHKNDLFFYDVLTKDENAFITGSAYAFIHFSTLCLFDVLKALQFNVPVLSFENENVREVAENAALYIENTTPEQIADKMKLIYKDELLRNQLIREGQKRVGQFSKNIIIDNLQEAIHLALRD